MAIYNGNLASGAAGLFVAAINANLIANPYWSLYDTPAENINVYRNNYPAGNSDFYVRVDDSNVGYVEFQLWQGWDAVGHAGTGSSLITIGTYELRCYKAAGGWFFRVRNDHFVWINHAWNGTYIGQIERDDASKNMPIYGGNVTQATATTRYNYLGYYSTANNCRCAALFDEGGATGQEINPMGRGAAFLFLKSLSGRFKVMSWPCYWETDERMAGVFPDICSFSSASQGLTNGETISVDGVDWLIFGGPSGTKYYAAMELA